MHYRKRDSLRSGGVPFVLAGALLVFTLPALADGVAIVGTELTDNGDNDGFADTYETTSLQVTVRNTTGLVPASSKSWR